MIVKLKHEKHGIHIAYSDEEVARCKENGWSEIDAPIGEPVAVSDPQEANIDEPKRRGRPRKIEG